MNNPSDDDCYKSEELDETIAQEGQFWDDQHENIIELQRTAWIQKYNEEHGGEVPPFFFRCAGEYWIISYEGKPALFRDIKGLHYIKHLLQHTYKPFNVSEMISIFGVSTDLINSHQIFSESDSDEHYNESGLEKSISMGNVANEKLYGTELKMRKEILIEAINTAKEELNTAEKNGDLPRISAMKESISTVEETLLKLKKGYSEKDPNTEKMRNSVSNRITDAEKLIGKHLPNLKIHLCNSIKKGVEPIYSPEKNPGWIF